MRVLLTRALLLIVVLDLTFQSFFILGFFHMLISLPFLPYSSARKHCFYLYIFTLNLKCVSSLVLCFSSGYYLPIISLKLLQCKVSGHSREDGCGLFQSETVDSILGFGLEMQRSKKAKCFLCVLKAVNHQELLLQFLSKDWRKWREMLMSL